MNNIQLYSAGGWHFVDVSMTAEYVYSLSRDDSTIVTKVCSMNSKPGDGLHPEIVAFQRVGEVCQLADKEFSIGGRPWLITLYEDAKHFYFTHRFYCEGHLIMADSVIDMNTGISAAMDAIGDLLETLDLNSLVTGSGELVCDGKKIIVQSDSDFVLNCENEDNLLFVNHDAFIVIKPGRNEYSAESLRDALVRLDCDLISAGSDGEYIVSVNGKNTGRILIGRICGEGAEVSYLLHSSNLCQHYDLGTLFSINFAEGVC